MSALIVNRLQENDETALDECYRQVGPLVRSYVGHFVPRDDVDDVVQQVFFELWRSRERMDPSRSLEAFVLGIARRRSIDLLRRRRNIVVDVEQIRGLMGEDGRELVERLAWAAEIRRALATLPDEQRESLEMAYFEDQTQAQIAERLGVPLGTVKARMARGARRLAAEIERGERQ
jgi:RNA polymerase sigma-70 factor (ECF subfamily)